MHRHKNRSSKSDSEGHEAAARQAGDGVRRSVRSGNEPMPQPLQRSMESRFSHDFGSVRIHAGDEANQSAQAMGANAYAVGTDIVFAEGQYAPETPSGERLLAHELTHVAQQGQSSDPVADIDDSSSALTFSHPADSAEMEAERAAGRVASGESVAVESGPTATVSRDLTDWLTGSAAVSGMLPSAADDAVAGDAAPASAPAAAAPAASAAAVSGMLPSAAGAAGAGVPAAANVPGMGASAAAAPAAAAGGVPSPAAAPFGGAAGATGAAAPSVVSTVAGAVTAPFSNSPAASWYQDNTNVKGAQQWWNQTVDSSENQAETAVQGAADQVQNPILGGMAQAGAAVVNTGIDAVGGVAKGIGDIAGGLENMALHPIDTATGLAGLAEQNEPGPSNGARTLRPGGQRRRAIRQQRWRRRRQRDESDEHRQCRGWDREGHSRARRRRLANVGGQTG